MRAYRFKRIIAFTLVSPIIGPLFVLISVPLLGYYLVYNLAVFAYKGKWSSFEDSFAATELKKRR